MKKNKANHKAKTDSQTVITPSQPVGPQGHRTLREVWAGVGSFLPFLLFFLLTWLWASWWMGDSFRVAREYSFFTFYKPLLHGLWQQPFGHLWIVGRALLTLYRWPLVGGLMVALLLACGTWLVAYCLRLWPDSRWRPLSYLPAVAWMTWVAWMGLDLYYHSEPGCALGVLFIGFFVLAIDAFVIWTFKGKSRRLSPCPPYEGGSGHLSGKDVLLLFLLVIPFALTTFRHPYQRPFMRMQVQLLNEDWDGIVETAHGNDALSYRPLAANYAIALVHNGHLTDAFFDIRLDYDTLYTHNYGCGSDIGTGLYLTDCDYHAGLFRTATHHAMEHLTMHGPTLFSLKHLTRLALLDYDWPLARKYLYILRQTFFESDFIERYEPMVEHPELVEADPVFRQLRLTEPVADSFESQYQEPAFLGYAATLLAGRSQQALMQSLMACLYSKRMPDFLMRCEPLMGTVPPRTIAEGLITQVVKNPQILQAFPQLQMNVQMYQNFIRNNAENLKDRPANARRLFDEYKGYYPYYYFFGNLKATRKRDDNAHAGSKAGVN